MPGMNTNNGAIMRHLMHFLGVRQFLHSWFPFLPNFPVILGQALTTNLLIFRWLLYYTLLRHNNHRSYINNSTTVVHFINFQLTTETFLVTINQTAVRDDWQQAAAVSEAAVICPLPAAHSISS
jgi:hypothetical protein